MYMHTYIHVYTHTRKATQEIIYIMSLKDAAKITTTERDWSGGEEIFSPSVLTAFGSILYIIAFTVSWSMP